MTGDFERLNEELIRSLINQGALKTRKIIEAFRKMPRHFFVNEEYLLSAYEDYPLPTLHGQTISQPYTVAVMLEALDPKQGNKILDVGAGSGWTGALLGHIVGKEGNVIAVDINPDIVELAKKNLKKTGLTNVEVICWDGKTGYSKESPYDRILVNAACDKLPGPIFKQTKIKGKIVIPINSFWHQDMTVIEKISETRFRKTGFGSFSFVPLQ